MTVDVYRGAIEAARIRHLLALYGDSSPAVMVEGLREIAQTLHPMQAGFSLLPPGTDVYADIRMAMRAGSSMESRNLYGRPDEWHAVSYREVDNLIRAGHPVTHLRIGRDPLPMSAPTYSLLPPGTDVSAYLMDPSPGADHSHLWANEQAAVRATLEKAAADKAVREREEVEIAAFFDNHGDQDVRLIGWDDADESSMVEVMYQAFKRRIMRDLLDDRGFTDAMSALAEMELDRAGRLKRDKRGEGV